MDEIDPPKAQSWDFKTLETKKKLFSREKKASHIQRIRIASDSQQKLEDNEANILQENKFQRKILYPAKF